LLVLIYGLTTAEAAKKRGRKRQQDKTLSLSGARTITRESSQDLVPGAEVEEESRRSTENGRRKEVGRGEEERMKLGYEICSSV